MDEVAYTCILALVRLKEALKFKVGQNYTRPCIKNTEHASIRCVLRVKKPYEDILIKKVTEN